MWGLKYATTQTCIVAYSPVKKQLLSWGMDALTRQQILTHLNGVEFSG